jgi:ABC-2 type transport system permease protein
VAARDPIQTLFEGSDASQATVAQSYASQIAGQFGAKMVGARMAGGVELRSRAWFNPSLESKFFNVPAIMGIQIMMISLILTAMAVVREREIGTLDQLLVSPIQPAELMLGKTIPVLLIGLFHLVIYTGLTVFQFGVPLKGAFLSLLLAALVYILGGLALGLLISTGRRRSRKHSCC